MIDKVLRKCTWCGNDVHMVTRTEHKVWENHRDPVKGQFTHVFKKFFTCPKCHVTTDVP